MRRFSVPIFALLAALAAVFLPARGQDAGPVESLEDQVTREALDAALLGGTGRLAELAGERARVEAKDGNWPKLGGSIALLSAASTRPLPSRAEARRMAAGLSWSAGPEATLLLLEQIEPRERFLNARASRRYESGRRVFNSMTHAVAGALTLHFFALIQPPLDAAEYVVTGHKFLNPEQRRELFAARGVPGGELPAAMRTAESLIPKRRATAMLQARRNAEECTRMGRLEVASWWYGREMLAAGENKPFRGQHRAVLSQLARARARQADSGRVLAGEGLLADADHFAAYSEIVKSFVASPDDPALPEAIGEFEVQYPWSASLPAMTAARAAAVGNAEGPAGAAVWLEGVAEGDSNWASISEAYLTQAAVRPEVAFARAKDAASARWWRFLLLGIPPKSGERSLTAEEARQLEAGWITRARSLFVVDIAGRAIGLPFLGGTFFPKRELLEAYARVPEAWRDSPAGRKHLPSVARALAGQKRFIDAARVYETLGDERGRRKMMNKAARTLEKSADRASDAAVKAEYLRRVVNAYPEYPKFERVRGKLDSALADLQVETRIETRELRRYPQLAGEEGLALGPELLDGDKSNGEIGRDGVELLEGNRIAYVDAATGARIELPVEPDVYERASRWVSALRRLRDVKERLDEPRERKRIPVGIEGGALPGISAAPVLIPLEIKERERRLYE